MKKLSLFFCFLLILLTQITKAQTSRLWGITEGVYDSGIIYQANENGGGFDSLYSFTNATGYMEYNTQPLTYASDGKLYSVAYYGGAYRQSTGGFGTIFSFDPKTNLYSDIHDFDSITGSNPSSNLIEVNGKLYGLTSRGGPIDSINDTTIYGNYGVIYSFDLSTKIFTVVHSFISDTSSPNDNYASFPCGLTKANNGLLYGVNEAAQIFSFDPNTNDFTLLYEYNFTQNFSGLAGTGPPSISLTQALDGKLYGTGSDINMLPVLFNFDLNVDTAAIIYYIDSNSNVGTELSGLTLGNDGKLYGVSYSGDTAENQSEGGFIYSYNTTSRTFTDVLNLNYSDGFFPMGNLLNGSDGKLYGTTSYDTLGGFGYIFSFDPSTSSIKTIHEINYTEGLPIGNLVEINLPYDVWPGDANNDLVVNNYDLLPIGLYYGYSGIARGTNTNTWAAQSCADWDSLQANGMNRKFVDCNGNGTINADDTIAVSLNYGLFHQYNSPWRSTERTLGTVPLTIVPDSSSYHVGSIVHAEVWLGNSNNPASNIYGLAYNIDFSATTVQSGTLSFNYDNSFIGTKNTNAITLTYLKNDIETVIVGTDHTNKNGYGKIGDIYFTLANRTSASNLTLSISNYEAVDASGKQIALLPINDTLSINGTSGINQLSINNSISIYPDPAKDQLTINSSAPINAIRFENVLGQLVLEQTFSNRVKQQLVDVNQLATGLYFVRITSGNEIVTGKIVISR